MAKSSQPRQDTKQRDLLFAAVDASDQIVMITGVDQRIVYVNGAFTRLTGYAPSEALGRSPEFLQGPDTNPTTLAHLQQAMQERSRVSAEILKYRKSGEPYWADVSVVPVGERSGAVTHWITIEREITARKAQEEEITRLAMEDHLTGLPNRRAAESRLQIEFSRTRRNGPAFAVALLDVDRFKLVNDQYGHQVGDLALVHLAKLLASNMRGGDWIARWGGEEFLVCFHDLDAPGAMTAGERVRKLVRANPVKLAQGELPLTVSAGIALCGPVSDSLEVALASADALLYQAKQTGRDKVLCAGMSRGKRGAQVWEGSQVQTALHEGRVVPAYQPIIDLRSGEVVGEEALARIIGAGNSPIAAQRFIPAAEQLRLLAAVDQAVSQKALERVAVGEKKETHKARLINLSAQFLSDRGYVSALLARVRALGLSGDGCVNPVVIEIAERQTDDLTRLQRDLQPLVEAGFRLALDDFGSGYASFMYLTDLPMSFLKIEGWMVGRIARDTRIRQLVESIVNTAARFEVKTIAECVETAESASVLRDIGVDWAQGHYFAKPQVAH